MKTFLILLLAVAVASAAKTNTKRATYSASLNKYVDEVVEILQPIIKDSGLDPLSLPNVTKSFSAKPLLITYSGRLSLFDGLLTDLADLRRYGDISLTYADKVLVLEANVGVDRLGIDYTYQSKLLGVTANGNAVGNVKEVDISGSLIADFETYTLGLNYFSINSIGKTSVNLKGNGLTDWLANIFVSIVTAVVQEDVYGTIGSTITSLIEDELASVNAVLAATRE